MYEVTFDLLNAGLCVVEPAIAPAEPTFMDDRDDTIVVSVIAADDKPEQRYPTGSRRSIVGHQPYDMYSPRTTFLQLGTTQAHRSTIKASCLVKMTKAERLVATTTSDITCNMIDNTMHKFKDKGVGIPDDTIQFKTRIAKVWTKGSRCSLERVDATARNEYLDSNGPDKAHKRRKDAGNLSFLFLKEKQTGTIK
jgi:hypothetical protein